MKNIFKIFAFIALVGIVFTSCQKDNLLEEKEQTDDSFIKNDKISAEGSVGYTDIFKKPSGSVNKTATYPIDIYFKNFSTGQTTTYKAVLDYTSQPNQVWLAENLKEEQFFATNSMTNPNDPSGSQYGYFYHYNDIDIEPQTIHLPFPPPFGHDEQLWGFYWDANCTQLISDNWRIPVHSDIQNLVNHVGATDRVALANYGIDVSFYGWYSQNIGWQSYIQDGMFWIKDNTQNPITYSFDHWTFRVSSYVTSYPYPEFFFSPVRNELAVNIRLVANL